MAKAGDNIHIALSPEDRRVLGAFADAMKAHTDELKRQRGIDPDASVADGPRRLVEVEPPAEGDWLLAEDHHEGEDVD